MNQNMKIHQKSTFSSRMKSRSHLNQLGFYGDRSDSSLENFGLDPTLILRLAEGMSKGHWKSGVWTVDSEQQDWEAGFPGFGKKGSVCCLPEGRQMEFQR